MVNEQLIGCRAKVYYGARKDAARGARRAERRGLPFGNKLHPYKCKFCDGFHLTSQPR